jgi:class 3 adenylate cyclase/tetratricopeptide (TPR) repeat protein
MRGVKLSLCRAPVEIAPACVERANSLMYGPDYLERYDAALAAIERGESVDENRRTAVLALARAGATQLALEKHGEFGLSHADDEDALSLKGRLLKDAGLMLGADRGRPVLRESAEAYFETYKATKGGYSGINAATLFLLSGRAVRARSQAQEVLELLQSQRPSGDAEARYFHTASIAEALLLLGRVGAADTMLGQAVSMDPENYSAHASTIRQFQLIMKAENLDPAWLDVYRPPAIACYAGRMQGLGPGDGGGERRLRRAAASALEDRRFGIAYGALAAGSDIILAEAFLAAGCALRVILPCTSETFVTQSVLPFGLAWRDRYFACLDRAESVDIATNDSSLMGRVAVQLAAELAMGRAVVCADSLATDAVQILMAPSGSGHHTEQSRITWQEFGPSRKTLVLDAQVEGAVDPRSPTLNLAEDRRRLAAMVFADFSGFGQLDDRQVATVVSQIMPGLADVLHSCGAGLMHLNSWGDGIFAMFDTVKIAGEAAISMQRRIQSFDFAELGLPATLALRVGGHYGPVSFAKDVLTERQSPFGSQIAYAARIEPIAIPGSILVSEAFAARLAISPVDHIGVSYIGRYQLKGMPRRVRLFALTDRANIEFSLPHM